MQRLSKHITENEATFRLAIEAVHSVRGNIRRAKSGFHAHRRTARLGLRPGRLRRGGPARAAARRADGGLPHSPAAARGHSHGVGAARREAPRMALGLLCRSGAVRKRHVRGRPLALSLLAVQARRNHILLRRVAKGRARERVGRLRGGAPAGHRGCGGHHVAGKNVEYCAACYDNKHDPYKQLGEGHGCNTYDFAHHQFERFH